jgi:membrane glycosyltransferase
MGQDCPRRRKFIENKKTRIIRTTSRVHGAISVSSEFATARTVSDEGVIAPNLAARRLVFLFLVLATMAGLTAVLTSLFFSEGLTGFEIAMIVLFALNTPWLSIGFWNAVIGFGLLHGSKNWLSTIVPIQGHGDNLTPINTRTAIVMPVFNEDPVRVLRHLRTVTQSLDATGLGAHFEIFLLSDTNRPALAAEEDRLFAQWRATDTDPERLHYRRRSVNLRQKVGNLEDFCERWGDGFDHMVVLDADSLMSGAAILRLVRLMQANPKLGILQSLITGLPSASAFARVFQFGMRHGMRSYTTGGAWWQGDEGPYWGHNAIIRMKPFRDHCRLPRLSGRGPLGGEILSHDQVEAVMMRGAGYEVRVLPLEDGSFEENPPTLQDFMKRDLRWCQGNIQYLKLLNMPGIRPLGRMQIMLAIMMYTAAPVWYAFMLTGMAQFVFLSLTHQTTLHDEIMGAFLTPMAEMAGGVALFVVVLTMNFTPKILGVLDVLLRPVERRRYGGGGALAVGALIEALFSMLIAPVAALAQTIFLAGLFLGRKVTWDAQARDQRSVTLGEAFQGLWPQTLMGLIFGTGLWIFAPEFLIWGAPVTLGLLLAAPFASLTSRPDVGQFFAKARLCAIPEEQEPPLELLWMGYGPEMFDARSQSAVLGKAMSPVPSGDQGD